MQLLISLMRENEPSIHLRNLESTYLEECEVGRGTRNYKLCKRNSFH
jgi:hypothetical protein